MTEEQIAEMFGFIEAVTAYLAEMMTRGDRQASQLFEQAVALYVEEPHEPHCPAADGFGCRCGEGA